MKVRFKDTEPPPLENSNIGAQRREPLDAEFVAAACDSIRNDSNEDTEGDDIGDE
jgi:hypothetical protein